MLLVLALLICVILTSLCWKIVKYLFWPAFLYHIFEDKGPHNLIFRWFIQKNERVNKIFYEVCEAATGKGFKFKYPRIAITKSWVTPLIFWGISYFPSNVIIIRHDVFKQLSNSNLLAVIAHELGHLIDQQTKRKGHPFFTEDIVMLEDEKFAWVVATYITSSKIVNEFFDKCNIIDPQ